MAVTELDLEKARELLDRLLGNRDEAQAYSKDPDGWLAEHGYSDVPAEAVATCGVGGSYGSGAVAAAPPAVAGSSAVQQIDYLTYNHYNEDNSITNNIENHGTLDFDQQVVTGDDNVVAGEGGVAAGDDIEDSTIQTGDGIQVGEDGNFSAGPGSQIETGEGDLEDVDVFGGGGGGLGRLGGGGDVQINTGDVETGGAGSPGSITQDQGDEFDLNVNPPPPPPPPEPPPEPEPEPPAV